MSHDFDPEAIYARAMRSSQSRLAVADDLIGQFPQDVYHAVEQTHEDDLGYPTLFQLEEKAVEMGYQMKRKGNTLTFSKPK